MIIDKRSMFDQSKNQEPRTKNQLLVSNAPVLGSRFSVLLRARWVRLLLLVLSVAALAALGAALGHGYKTGVAVVSQAVGPTVAAVVTAVPQPANVPPQVVTAAPAPAINAVDTPAAPVLPETANVAQGWPVLSEEQFDGVSELWPEVRSSPSWSSRYQDGSYLMQVDSRPGISYSGPLGAHDFWYSADVKLTRGQAGLFFLIGRPNDFYRLLIDTAGRYQLEWQQVGVSQPLIAWTVSPALLRGADQVNQIAVARSGDELTLYANGTWLTTYTLPVGNMLESRIGLALDAPESGGSGVAWFDNVVVRAPR